MEKKAYPHDQQDDQDAPETVEGIVLFYYIRNVPFIQIQLILEESGYGDIAMADIYQIVDKLELERDILQYENGPRTQKED